jgi:GT2 family glycosyltransferase
MSPFAADIVVPVWNEPVETRNCLVSLAEHSPQARLVLVDNGSDRETERLLEEFAEFLDHRALLVRSDRNLGFVPAVNRGLDRAEADFIAIVRTSSVVGPGWLDPLLEYGRTHRDAGLLVPSLAPGRAASSGPAGSVRELDHGSLSAMVVRRELHRLIGGLDPAMDAGLWCLKDYSRRAWRAAFRTVTVAGGTVSFREEAPLGSQARREEALRRSVELNRERWGEERVFRLHLPKGTDLDALRRHRALLVRGARQGHRFSVFLPARLARESARAVMDPDHENIRWLPYPALFTARWLRREVEKLGQGERQPTFVRCEAGEGLPGVADSLPYSELERLIADGESRYFAR